MMLVSPCIFLFSDIFPSKWGNKVGHGIESPRSMLHVNGV